MTDALLDIPERELGGSKVDTRVAPIAARHLVAALAFGDGRFTECTCGERFVGKTDEAVATAFNRHAHDRNHRRR